MDQPGPSRDAFPHHRGPTDGLRPADLLVRLRSHLVSATPADDAPPAELALEALAPAPSRSYVTEADAARAVDCIRRFRAQDPAITYANVKASVRLLEGYLETVRDLGW